MVFNIFSFTVEVRVKNNKRNKNSYYETCLDIDEMREQNFLRYLQEVRRL